MWIGKVGVGHAHFNGFGIHIGDELACGTGSGPGESHGTIVIGTDDDRAKKFTDRNGFTGAKRHGARFDPCIFGRHCDGAFAACLLINEDGGH